MEQLRIDYDDRVVRAALKRLRAAVDDLEPAMREIAGHLKDSVDEGFASQAAPDGTAWKPLALRTRRQRKRQGYGESSPILERSGDLASKILADWDDESAEVGSNQTYDGGDGGHLAAAVHHFGTRDKHVPARPIFGVTGEHRGMIIESIRDRLAAAAVQGGSKP